MRVAVLADALRHSRSRMTHTVTRMEEAGLVRRARRLPPTCGEAREYFVDLSKLQGQFREMRSLLPSEPRRPSLTELSEALASM